MIITIITQGEGFQSYDSHPLTMSPGANNVLSLKLSLHICNVGRITVSILHNQLL